MDTLVIQILNSLFYASILFLIASGLTLVYGVMRIVNMAHGNLYALGAYVAAWCVGLVAATFPAGGAVPAPPPRGRCRGPRRRHPGADAPPAALQSGGGVPAPDHVRPPPDPRGPPPAGVGSHPLTASALSDALGSFTILGATYPGYNLFVIAVGVMAAVALWAFVYRTRFGVMLRATSQDMRHGVGARRQRQARRTSRPSRSAASWPASAAPWSCRFRGPSSGWASTRSSSAFVVVVIGGSGLARGGAGRRPHRGRGADARHHVLRGDRAGGALPDRGGRPVHSPGGTLRPRMTAARPMTVVSLRPRSASGPQRTGVRLGPVPRCVLDLLGPRPRREKPPDPRPARA